METMRYEDLLAEQLEDEAFPRRVASALRAAVEVHIR